MIDSAKIREKRKALGLTAQELADRLGVRVESLYKWEKGTMPGNPEDYRKMESWLSGKVEIVPKAPTTPPQPDTSSTVHNLSQSVLILAKNNEALVSAIVNAGRGTQQGQEWLIEKLEGVAAEIASKKRTMSADDILAKLKGVVSGHSQHTR